MTRKERFKNKIKEVYTLISLVIAFVTAALIWYWNVAPGWVEGFFGYRTLTLVGIMFSVVYLFFAKMYDAHKIGLYRLQELAFSQMLSFSIGDFCLIVATFFWFSMEERSGSSLPARDAREATRQAAVVASSLRVIFPFRSPFSAPFSSFFMVPLVSSI